MLNWYHETLINVIRPVVNANSTIMAILFGLYGPEEYHNEEEDMKRALKSQILILYSSD